MKFITNDANLWATKTMRNPKYPVGKWGQCTNLDRSLLIAPACPDA
jgi:hypothetical protein